jgi:hypothetical protein
MEISLKFAILLLIVAAVLIECNEKYYVGVTHLLQLDSHWKGVRKHSNDGNRVRDPFNTCSPESYDECARKAMPHLSRY